MEKLYVAGENEYEILKGAYGSIENKIPFKPHIAVVLGTGLGNFTDDLKIDKQIDFDEIINFPKTTNEYHKGRFIFTKISAVNVVCMQGRIHYYEGYDSFETVRPIRLLAMMGVKKIIITNAAGGIRKDLNVGDLMLINDHISFFVPNPLRGKNIDEIGTRFPDMSEPYDKEVREKVKTIAKNNNIDIKEGVYVQTSGPTFETKAEIQMLEKMGADAVAMSLGIEVIAARHAGMKVCGISMITNKATGYREGEHSNEEVRDVASKNVNRLEKLIKYIIPEI